jgi:hypothetical protein
MFNESLLSSLNELKDILLFQLTLLHVAHVYILMYVIYKALGRYIYFKPQEHESKINRTFLTLSLIIVSVHCLGPLLDYIPILPEHRWLFMSSILVFIAGVLSISMYRVIWKNEKWGDRMERSWHYDYLQISKDYYKTSVSKSEKDGNFIHSWEEEGVESTSKNVHSDALLNILALITFLVTTVNWSYQSMGIYGWYSIFFSVIASLSLGSIFFNQAIFSWISYLKERKR